MTRKQTLMISIIIYLVSDFIDFCLPTIHNGWWSSWWFHPLAQINTFTENYYPNIDTFRTRYLSDKESFQSISINVHSCFDSTTFTTIDYIPVLCTLVCWSPIQFLFFFFSSKHYYLRIFCLHLLLPGDVYDDVVSATYLQLSAFTSMMLSRRYLLQATQWRSAVHKHSRTYSHLKDSNNSIISVSNVLLEQLLYHWYAFLFIYTKANYLTSHYNRNQWHGW